MSEKSLEAYEEFLKILFKCNGVKLAKIFKLLDKARSRYGEQVFNVAVKYILETPDESGAGDCINTAYYYVVAEILEELVKPEKLDDWTCETLIKTNFNEPKTRITPENLEELPVSQNQIPQIIQEINDFLASLTANY